MYVAYDMIKISFWWFDGVSQITNVTFFLISSWGPWGFFFLSTSAWYSFSIRIAICNSWGRFVVEVVVVDAVDVVDDGGGTRSDVWFVGSVGSVATMFWSCNFRQNRVRNDPSWSYNCFFVSFFEIFIKIIGLHSKYSLLVFFCL